MAHRHHVKVQSRHTLRVSETEARRDPRTPISALSNKTLVAQTISRHPDATVASENRDRLGRDEQFQIRTGWLMLWPKARPAAEPRGTQMTG